MAAVAAATKQTILIVDDEDDIREMLKDIFEDEGFAVDVAANGAIALALLQQKPPPSVIVLDLRMPVMDGRQLYETMKATPSLAHIPVIISTSDPSFAPSGVLIIRKPVALDLLLDAVRKFARQTV